MRLITPALLFALALAPAPVAARDARTFAGVPWAQVSVHERIVIRVPRPGRAVARGRGRGARIDRPVWSERKAPRCIPVSRLAGAGVSQGGDVDLMLIDGGRVRAKLERDCPALDFYSGFYLKPNVDGMICGGRDVLRARSGGVCPIARFRRLEARR